MSKFINGEIYYGVKSINKKILHLVYIGQLTGDQHIFCTISTLDLGTDSDLIVYNHKNKLFGWIGSSYSLIHSMEVYTNLEDAMNALADGICANTIRNKIAHMTDAELLEKVGDLLK